MKLDIKEIGCKDARWMVLAEDRVQSWVFILTFINFGFNC
jgi:hypothetical protein